MFYFTHNPRKGNEKRDLSQVCSLEILYKGKWLICQELVRLKFITLPLKLDNACTANAMQHATHLARQVKERCYVKGMLKLQQNSILETAFSVGKHKI